MVTSMEILPQNHNVERIKVPTKDIVPNLKSTLAFLLVFLVSL